MDNGSNPMKAECMAHSLPVECNLQGYTTDHIKKYTPSLSLVIPLYTYDIISIRPLETETDIKVFSDDHH